jgi:hypothetical protein
VEFEKFWEVWPKKVAKKKAESAWGKLSQLESEKLWKPCQTTSNIGNLNEPT